ncbi:somatolactin beta [Aplochiton taeniatus]
MKKSKVIPGCLLLLLGHFQGILGNLECQESEGAPCTISLEKLLDRAIQHAELIYLVSEESFTLFEDLFIPYNMRPQLSRTGNLCTSNTLSIPNSRSQLQTNSDKLLLQSILFLVKFWIDPVINLQTSLDRYDNAPMMLITKTKWISVKLSNLEQGLTVLIKKMFGVDFLMLEQPNDSLADYPIRSDMMESVLRDYTLLACLRKDSHKIETFLKLLKCRQTEHRGCPLV